MIITAFVVFALLVDPSRAAFGDKENPFRMKKLNMIWKKAQDKMSERKLNEFRRMLQLQDRAEMKWKELKSKGGDEDGEKEAIVRRKFAHILEEFGLEKHLEAVQDQDNEIKDNSSGKGKYGDKRLNKLWDSVVKQGKFSSEELGDLQTEFNHHKDKLTEHNNLLKIINDQESLSENSVLSQRTDKGKELGNLRDQLQDSQLHLSKDFARLKEKASGDKQEKLFHDPRVNELWDKAKNGGFSETELDSIKQELDHFDHKIMKHEHFKTQAKESRQLIKEGHPHLQDKHDMLDKQAKEHAKWVKKMHATLMNKVERNEL